MPRTGKTRLIWLGAAVVGLAGWADGLRLVAQESAAGCLDPRTFGLAVSPGPLQGDVPPTVLTTDAQGGSVVARVHVQVGETRIVLLPEGTLVARAVNETAATVLPFVPLGQEKLAAQLLAALPSGFKARQTIHYVYVYNTSEPFAEVTSRLLETMLRGVLSYMQTLQVDVHPPELPLGVILFRTAGEFQRYRRMPADVVAYYDVLTNQIVVYEESGLWQIKPELALQQTLATIAHEGAHQILHNIGAQQRLAHWPLWLSEGLAEFLAPTTTDRQLRWKGAGQCNDLRMFELEQYLKSRPAEEANGQLVAQTVGAARLTSTGYAAAWALTQYLAKYQREPFQRFVREASRLRPLAASGRVVPPGVIPEHVRLFKAGFGDDLADLERRLLLHLQRQPYLDPFADWPHFAALLTVPVGRRERREANVFHTPEQAEKWCREIRDQLPAEHRGTAATSVRPFPSRLAAEQFVRQWVDGN